MKKLTLITAILMTANLLLGQWYQLPNPYPNDDTLREIYFIDQDHGFIGGHWNSSYDGFMHSSSDGGFTWDYYLQWIELHPYRILFLDENNGWFIEGGAQAPWFDKSKKCRKAAVGFGIPAMAAKMLIAGRNWMRQVCRSLEWSPSFSQIH